MEKHFITALILHFFVSIAFGQQKTIYLYNGPAPGSENWNWEEKDFFVKTPLNANVTYNITQPTLSVFYPDTANGTAVIICPGGAYHVLNTVTEGSNVANALTKKGITVFLFKYRLVQSVTDDPWQEMMNARKDSSIREKVSVVKKMARADLNTVIAYVRKHATEFKIDPTRIGLMGFSAGGALAANVAYNFSPDARPDFIAAIYSVIATIEKSGVKQDAPPLFIAAATDDQLAQVSNSVNLYSDWMNANKSAELHIYAKGGHGLRDSSASKNWINRFLEWLDMQGLLGKGSN